MSKITYLVLFILCIGFSKSALAVDSYDVATYWVESKYGQCETLRDFIGVRANQIKMRELAADQCDGLPKNPKNCFQAADEVLSEKFTSFANSQGCKQLKQLPQAPTASSPYDHSLSSACQSRSMLGPKTIATNKGSKTICELRTTCRSKFQIYGKNLEKGDYRFTCAVPPGTGCSTVSVEGCSQPTVQEIGLIFNGDEIHLNEAAGVQ